MKLNRNGYMLIEIIISSVLAMTIAYYLLNLTYKFKNTNEDIFESISYTKDKILVTKNIMNDLENRDISSARYEITTNSLTINFYTTTLETEQLRLYINKENDKTTIEYGKILNGGFDTSDVSYYKKELPSTLIVNKLEEPILNAKNISIIIPLKSIYDDFDYSIKIFKSFS